MRLRVRAHRASSRATRSVRAELERRERVPALAARRRAGGDPRDGRRRALDHVQSLRRTLLGWRAERRPRTRAASSARQPQPDDAPLLVPPSDSRTHRRRARAPAPGTEVPARLARDVRCSPNSAGRRTKRVLRAPATAARCRCCWRWPRCTTSRASRGGLIAVATDLTERKRLEAALRDSEARAQEANLAKSAFLAAMSHEIRTPMIGVTGMVEILAHTPLDADQRRALNVIQQSAAIAAADHRRHPRLLEDRGRAAGAVARAGRPAARGAQRRSRTSPARRRARA